MSVSKQYYRPGFCVVVYQCRIWCLSNLCDNLRISPLAGNYEKACLHSQNAVDSVASLLTEGTRDYLSAQRAHALSHSELARALVGASRDQDARLAVGRAVDIQPTEAVCAQQATAGVIFQHERGEHTVGRRRSLFEDEMSSGRLARITFVVR